MDPCPHIDSFTGPINESLLDPSRWQCTVCGTTEWVWGCLTCSNIACGRMNEQHAEQHFYSTKHPLAVEINEKYVYCYVCDEYVLTDNSRGDLEAIRSALTDIGTLSLEEVKDKGGQLLKSYSHQQEFSRNQADENDRLITAICHHRKSLLAKVFSGWQSFVLSEKEQKLKTSTTAIPTMMTRARTSLFHVKKRTLIPGVTGLRNLGNTCYINSILQALGHLEDFREFFCQIIFGLFTPTGTPLPGSSPSNSTSPLAVRNLLRLNTIDFFQHLSNGARAKTNKGSSSKANKTPSPQQKKAGGLNGGGCEEENHTSPQTGAKPGSARPRLQTDTGQKLALEAAETGKENSSILEAKANVLKALSLCQEMHGLLRVLWSGKWAQVSPHGFLQALWRTIPAFKGHLQHDAQEFLCELLDKMSQEIENLPQCKGLKNVIDQSFRGEFVSQVTCMGCKNVSCRYEPFLDVSLEFPRRFQSTSTQVYRNMCHVTEMLSSFTDVEDLEPMSYSCENCSKKRRRSSRQKVTKTNAKKQLLVSRPPEILRLHLKRFRWCGRNNREKIGTHVMFDEELDISPFCKAAQLVPRYRLSAVVVHHGAGFRAGHYTAFAYNNSAGSWLHCNDSRVQLVTLEEVLASQAYILFYTRELATVSLEDLPALAPSSDSDRQSNISTLPELDADTLQTLRRGETQHNVDDEVMLSFHRDPALVRRLSSITPGSEPAAPNSSSLSTATTISPAVNSDSANHIFSPTPSTNTIVTTSVLRPTLTSDDTILISDSTPVSPATTAASSLSVSPSRSARTASSSPVSPTNKISPADDRKSPDTRRRQLTDSAATPSSKNISPTKTTRTASSPASPHKNVSLSNDSISPERHKSRGLMEEITTTASSSSSDSSPTKLERRSASSPSSSPTKQLPLAEEMSSPERQRRRHHRVSRSALSETPSTNSTSTRLRLAGKTSVASANNSPARANSESSDSRKRQLTQTASVKKARLSLSPVRKSARHKSRSL